MCTRVKVLKNEEKKNLKDENSGRTLIPTSWRLLESELSQKPAARWTHLTITVEKVTNVQSRKFMLNEES